jgi:dTDP-4-amino-4,6-dideoxygalactose transaminase
MPTGRSANIGGRWLGTIGHLGALSFHETKNLQCGEGGALLVNLSRLQVDAEVIRDKGTNRGAYQRGKVDKYEWVSLGSSYVIADILAAFLWGQLECRQIAARSRRLRWTRYYEVLKPWANSHGIDLPSPPPHCEHTHHIFYLVMTSRAARNQFISHLKKARITAAFHFVPLHDSPMGKTTGRATLPCPVAQSISQRLVRLPLYNNMDDEEQERVLDSILDAEIQEFENSRRTSHRAEFRIAPFLNSRFLEFFAVTPLRRPADPPIRFPLPAKAVCRLSYPARASAGAWEESN